MGKHWTPNQTKQLNPYITHVLATQIFTEEPLQAHLATANHPLCGSHLTHTMMAPQWVCGGYVYILIASKKTHVASLELSYRSNQFRSFRKWDFPKNHGVILD